jgi:RNA polymerase subunit RPABC4/transcription elongation factor Spt4
VVLVVVGGLSALTTIPVPTSPAGSSHLTAAVPPFTHGDLVVTSGETFVIQPTPGTHMYYQGGNITVDLGGTLIVRNVTLSFVQFIANSGTAMGRLSHIDRFVDMGTVRFFNATLTTDVQIINAWAKLNVTVANGTMSAWNSTFAFPGWLTVVGPTAQLTLNDSRVTGNPAVATLAEPATILGDTLYAPSITVTAGAQMNTFNSSISDTYADNTLVYGQPQPVPLGLPSNPILVPIVHGVNEFSSLYTPSDSANLTQDWLYPNAVFQAGNLVGNWNNPNKTLTAHVSLSVVYNGVTYPILGTLIFTNQSYGSFSAALPTNLLQTITADGVLNYLNWTGDFGVTPGRIAIEFDVLSGPAVVNVSADLSLLPSLDYNVMVSGASSTLNSVDTSFGLNWNALPTNSTSQNIPLPWNSNKLLLADGAVAYLANATVMNPLPGVFSTSAVLPDATSQAFFYRWAQFNLSGRGGFLPIPEAKVSAFYAYTTNEANNATANALNDLATANPEIWGYVQYWDGQRGISTYGTSNVSGIASLLLASSNLTGLTLPDGYFLGGYHVGIVVPAVGVPSHWLNWSVSPYPQGVAQLPPTVAGPDFAPPQIFPQYFGGVAISSATVLANGVASTSVNLGQTLSVKLVVEDIGTAPITQLKGTLLYNDSGLPSALLASLNNTGLDLTTPGQTIDFTLSWMATVNVTGLHPAFQHNLTVILDWNNNNARLAGGNLSQNVSVTFAPTLVTIESATVLANGVANTTIDLGQTLGVKLVLGDVGNGTIAALSAWLYYNDSDLPTALLATYETASLGLSAAGQTATILLSWVSTENITGLHGWFDHNLTVKLTWNNVTIDRWLGNGSLAQNVTVKIAPSEIRFVSFGLPPSTLDLSQQYFSAGFLAYNGSQPAAIELSATPVGGGQAIEVAAAATKPGNFSMPWFTLQQLLIPGTTYTLTASASYNGRETNDTLPGTYAVPPTPSSSSNFFTQKFLGLPLWVWLAIAAAAAIAIVLFLFVVRRKAAGKLVECGECGNLIPEDATVCPKCGAEFESDLIRCSRCASTIPADSKNCPECAAQLLGTPGEAESDPEKQAYADFTEKYRAEGKRELGDNYSEGAFWDWWKRQPTYTPFSQWSLQQGTGTARAGMTAPPAGTETTPEAEPGQTPPKGGAGWKEGPPAGATAPTPAAPPAETPTAAPAGAGLKACPSCGKEIPSEYLVCPFCNAVTS